MANATTSLRRKSGFVGSLVPREISPVGSLVLAFLLGCSGPQTNQNQTTGGVSPDLAPAAPDLAPAGPDLAGPLCGAAACDATQVCRLDHCLDPPPPRQPRRDRQKDSYFEGRRGL